MTARISAVRRAAAGADCGRPCREPRISLIFARLAVMFWGVLAE